MELDCRSKNSLEFRLKLTYFGKNKNLALRVIRHKDLDSQSVSTSLDATKNHYGGALCFKNGCREKQLCRVELIFFEKQNGGEYLHFHLIPDNSSCLLG